MAQKFPFSIAAIACMLMYFTDTPAVNINPEAGFGKEAAPMQGCTGSKIDSAWVTTDSCNGNVCLNIKVSAEGMHGIENWHFDFGNGKSWDTATTLSKVSCPGPISTTCTPTGVCTCFCEGNTLPCPTAKTVFTKCGIYTSFGTYTISMAVTPAHSTCVNSWVVQVNCVPTSIPNYVSERNLSIFPNPSQGSFTVKMHDLPTGNLRLRIFNYLGQDIYQSQENLMRSDHEKQIQLPNASKGVYLLRIDTGNGFLAKKFMIE